MIKANKKQILILLSGVGMALSLAVQAEGTHEKGDIFVKGKLMYVYPTSSSSDTFDINGYDTEVHCRDGRRCSASSFI